MSWFLIITITVLGFLFPSLLIDAIRAEDEEKADERKMLSCLCFGALACCMAIFSAG